MNRRSGSSLVEVLVAIFVMGLGLIALLTLFPIGMLRMAAAIRDAKCAQAAQNAHTLATLYRLCLDPAVITDAGPPAIPDMFVNPYKIDPLTMTPTPWKDADPFGESYAVFVDPIGYYSGAGSKDWVGNMPGQLRRRPTSYAATAQARYKSFTLLDDMKFETTYDPSSRATTPGTPYKLTAATNTFRDNRYSWGYLLRRPQTSEPTIVDCSIVVFELRDDKLALPEYVYFQTTYFDTLRNAITIDYTNNVPPPIRPGNWLLDATIYNYDLAKPYVFDSAVGPNKAATQHAYFYKVVAVEEIVVAGTPAKTLVRYDVSTPIRGFSPTYAGPTDPTYGFIGTAIVLDGIAEVYEKGPVRLP